MYLVFTKKGKGKSNARVHTDLECTQVESPLSGRACLCASKGPMGLVVRTIRVERAKVKIGIANLAYNMRRFVETVADRLRNSLYRVLLPQE